MGLALEKRRALPVVHSSVFFHKIQTMRSHLANFTYKQWDGERTSEPLPSNGTPTTSPPAVVLMLAANQGLQGESPDASRSRDAARNRRSQRRWTHNPSSAENRRRRCWRRAEMSIAGDVAEQFNQIPSAVQPHVQASVMFYFKHPLGVADSASD